MQSLHVLLPTQHCPCIYTRPSSSDGPWPEEQPFCQHGNDISFLNNAPCHLPPIPFIGGMISFLGTALNEHTPCPSALCILVSSSFPQRYDTSTPFLLPKGIYVPLPDCLLLLCMLTFPAKQVQSCPESHYRPTLCSWPPNK